VVGRQPTPWLLREPRDEDGPVVFCFPYGGAGASSLRRWPARIGDAEVLPVQLPGRENRIRESPCSDFPAFAKEAVAALRPYLDRPWAVAGHCMGALLAHAFAVEAQEQAAPLPKRLFVSASLVPYRGFYGFYHPWMSDRRIMGELRRVAAGLGEADLPDELLALSVDVLRSDVLMCLGYLPPVQPVDVPITAVAWTDDPDVGPAELHEWADYGETREYVLPGEPLSFLSAPAALRRIVEDDFEY
jgi:surfactin synthase thioesterase subunit